jgi:hypothetical protein
MNIRIFNTVLAIALFSAFPALPVLGSPDSLSILWENKTDEDLFYAAEVPFSYVHISSSAPDNTLGAHTDWSNNPGTSSPFTKIFKARLDGEGTYQANFTFLRNDTQAQVIVDSPYTKSKTDFNIADIGDFFFHITIDKIKQVSVQLTAINPAREIQSLQEQAEQMQIQRAGIEQKRILGRPGHEQLIEKKQVEKLFPLLPRK